MRIYEPNYPDWYREDDDRRMRDRVPAREQARAILEDVESEIELLERRLERLYGILEGLDG